MVIITSDDNQHLVPKSMKKALIIVFIAILRGRIFNVYAKFAIKSSNTLNLTNVLFSGIK